MAKNNITGDYAKLEQYYIQKVINISNEVGFSYIVWQEVIDNGIKVPLLFVPCTFSLCVFSRRRPSMSVMI